MPKADEQVTSRDDLLITESLIIRPRRHSNLLAEIQAMQELARCAATQPNELLDRLVVLAVQLCDAGSAGISLLEETPEGETIFRWVAVAGSFSSYVGGFTPRNHSPCGICLDRNEPILLSRPYRVFEYFNDASPAIIEGLILPFYGEDGDALGTIWIVSHEEGRGFDQGTLETMKRLAEFTALALRMTNSIAEKDRLLHSSQHEIAERKKTEEALRASEERFRKLFERSNDGIFLLDPERDAVLEVNPAGVAMFGYDSREELLATPLSEFYPEDLPSFLQFVQDVHNEGAGWTDEFACRAKGGDRVASEISASTIVVNGRRCLLALVRDVTERKQAQAALAESEERYRTLFASAPMAVFVCDRNAVIQHCNSRAVELWGREPILGVEKHCGSVRLWLPDGSPLPHEQSPIVEVLRTGMPVTNIEVSIERPDGARLPVIVNFAAIKDPQGAITGAITSFVEITERKRDEQRMLGQRHVLEMVATGAPLQETLDELMRFIEAQEPGARCGILIVTDDGQRFRRGAGPNLPETYHDALDGVPITPPYLGSCGEAANECTSIVVPDIVSETRYADQWRDMLLTCGMKAVRSTPVRGSDGRVLASIAIYYDRPRDPNPADPQLIDIVTHLAAIAIERDRDFASQVAARERQKLLIDELNHRVKNTLATVQSFASQTLRNSNSLAEARSMFDSRLLSLAKAHDVLTSQNWEGADLRTVVDRALDAHRTAKERVTIEGSDVRLSPKQALALSMALHELATNAAKYGALSNDSGRVQVGWHVRRNGGAAELDLSWTEEGGPLVTPPTRKGFGSRLIERNLANELAGQVRIEYRPAGVVANIRTPVERFRSAI
ncbi:MAG TPA: PAS domain S-box protein [Sphingomicrobium sp.]|nr:PAS domain S-box protein [Sphingomicrobium sp.]